MKKKSRVFVTTLALVSMLFAACGTKPAETPDITDVPEVTEAPATTAPTETPVPTAEPTATPEPTPEPPTAESLFENLELSSTLKKFGYDAPVMTQRYGADPCAMVYDGRVYIYMTGDVVEYRGGKAIENTYSKINTINVISSDDLVNWTDHGTVYAAGRNGAAKWGGNSWAPTAAYKEIDGEMKFFLYFANNGNGIGVLTADSPVGPFTDPLGKALISRGTPNCSNVDWLFDPAVLVEEDGSAYIYFGGGVPAGKAANPGTGRVAKLGADMISLDGDPVAFDIPYLFEDSGINKIGDTYYYSYCTNWQVDDEGKKTYGFSNAQIAYMTSKNPMGPFTYQGVVFKNQNDYFPGNGGNNHHSIFEFDGKYYITYHTRVVSNQLGLSGLNYRSTHVTEIQLLEDGSFEKLPKTNYTSLKQVKALNPYEKTEAETIATMGGIETTQEGMISKTYGSGNMVLSEIQTGDWVAVYGADFGENGATAFTASVKAEKGTVGAIQIRLDSTDGEVVGCLTFGEEADGKNYQEVTAELDKTVTGVHDLVFVFGGENYTVDYWQFQ